MSFEWVTKEGRRLWGTDFILMDIMAAFVVFGGVGLIILAIIGTIICKDVRALFGLPFGVLIMLFGISFLSD